MNIQWHLDSNTAFDVVVIGKGNPLPKGQLGFGGFDLFSPSGFWEVNSGDTVIWDVVQQDWQTINGGGSVMYNEPVSPPVAVPFLQFNTFHSNFTQSGIVWSCANTANNGTWTGNMTLNVAWLNPYDPYLWRWSTHYWGSGPALIYQPRA